MTNAPMTPAMCGAQYDDETCDLDLGHDGPHCANLSVGWTDDEVAEVSA